MGLGSSLPRFQRSPANRNLLAITANAILNTSEGANTAITAPQTTPNTAGAAHTRITPGTTKPSSRCARIYDAEAESVQMSPDYTLATDGSSRVGDCHLPRGSV